MLWCNSGIFPRHQVWVWKPQRINSNHQGYNTFLGGGEWDSFCNTLRSYIMSESPCVFTALMGPTLINANHKQISLALMHHLSPSLLTTWVSSPSHAHQRHPIWKPLITHPCRCTVCVCVCEDAQETLHKDCLNLNEMQGKTFKGLQRQKKSK